MNRFKLLYFVIFIIKVHKINAQISDKRLCVDEECKVPISLAKTLLRYSSPDSRILSFAPNVDITIYSKSAGSREDLWGGEINGKRGYVPKHMVRETKVLKKPTFLVATEFSNDTETKQVPSSVEPDKVQEPYEVVDGTTIYLSPHDINPTSTESPIQSTALPAETTTSSESEKTPNEDEIVDSNLKQSQESDSPIKEQPISDETLELKEDVSNLNDDESDPEDEEAEVDADDDLTEEDDYDEDEEPEGVIENESDNQINTETIEKPVEPETKSSNSVEADGVEETEKNVETITVTEDVTLSQNPITPNEDPLPIQPAKQEIKETSDSPTVADVEKPIDLQQESEPVQETVESVSNDNEATVPPSISIEVTTLSPEYEVPQPLDDGVLEVTPNPLDTVVTEGVEKAPDDVPTVPPLGLFGFHANSYTEVSSEDVQSEQNTTEEKIDENIKVTDSVELKVDDATEAVDDEHAISGGATNIENPVSEEINISQESTEANLSQETTETYVSQETTETSVSQETSNEKSSSSEIFEQNDEKSFNNEEKIEESPGFFARILAYFEDVFSEEEPSQNDALADSIPTVEEKPSQNDALADSMPSVEEGHVIGDDLLSTKTQEPFCDATSCEKSEENNFFGTSGMDLLNFNSDVFLYLVTTAISVIIFLFGYIAFDKNKREGPLVAKINNLEKELLVVLKENQILQEKVATDSGYENNGVSSAVLENLKQDLIEMATIRSALEDQVQSLEKELENSTEVGMELNRMLSEILSSESGSDVLKANVEHLQRQLVEQQSTINSVNETLAITNTENHELRLELELSNKKVFDLQAELDKLLTNILKIEEEKDMQQSTLEAETANFKQKYDEINRKLRSQQEENGAELKQLQIRLDETVRKLELKTNEHDILIDNLKQLKSVKNNAETIQNIIEVGDMRAEMRLLKSENQKFSDKIQQAEISKTDTEKRAQVAIDENRLLKEKYDEADKSRVEAQTKLEVLSNYFKDREAQWQKEISKHESLWAEKEGEATSTTERIKFMQEQLQNYKIQTESLKQEIMSQEIELKSQISVLEKKAHENWVSARQSERKLEESKQEASQLRHRLTLRERAIQEDKNQQRLQSPIEQNGDMIVSALESPSSPLLYNTRDHITKSPPIPGLPPFLPPPPGVPFMPPPLHGVPPFIPPPPQNMFPGDHRPPPLGRMSSPPINSRYSPGSRGYSPYDRNSSSPSDSEYGTSPPHRRGYSPFNNRMEDRRDYKRPPPTRTNGRNIKGGASSGSGHSNESLEKISRQQSKV